MYEDVTSYAKKIIELLDEIENYKKLKDKLSLTFKKIDDDYRKKTINESSYKKLLKEHLGNKSRKEIFDSFDNSIKKLLLLIKKYNDEMYSAFYKNKKFPRNKGISDFDKEYLEKFISMKHLKTKSKEKKYTVYEHHPYVSLSNRFMRDLAISLLNKFPKFFQSLETNLKQSAIKILSKSYISTMLFSSILMFFVVFIVSFLLIFKIDIYFALLKSFLFSVLGFIFVFFSFYYYPSIVVSGMKRGIKAKLPFAIIHMSAIVSSGAPPITMFDLLLKSKEYGSLAGEIKRIMNYVNLFGYDLNTALKVVAKTTPSKEFGELLNGIVATVESGGDLKEYLKAKADDTMTAYKLERRKFNQVIETLSDVYTGVMITAPLLFVIVLALINAVGGNVYGVTAVTLATLGTYVVIPILNIMFILFVSVTQPEL